jgi:hypothetical protein
MKEVSGLASLLVFGDCHYTDAFVIVFYIGEDLVV